jgi:hypothetical protein
VVDDEAGEHDTALENNGLGLLSSACDMLADSKEANEKDKEYEHWRSKERKLFNKKFAACARVLSLGERLFEASDAAGIDWDCVQTVANEVRDGKGFAVFPKLIPDVITEVMCDVLRQQAVRMLSKDKNNHPGETIDGGQWDCPWFFHDILRLVPSIVNPNLFVEKRFPFAEVFVLQQVLRERVAPVVFAIFGSSSISCMDDIARP